VELKSNVTAVLDRAKRRVRDVPVAIAAVLEPERWREAMAQDANRTLWALAQPGEWRSVKLFLDTILTGKLADGFFSAMSNPVPPVMDIGDFAIVNHMQLTQTGDGQSGPGLFSHLLNDFDAMMTDWVANEKRKDIRDWGKTDEEIGRWIGYLMLTPDKQLSPKEQSAKAALMPYIVDYIARRQTAQRLADGTVNAWLQAVLASWHALVRREFPVRLEAQLAQMREGLL
jgi:hypothetical protein